MTIPVIAIDGPSASGKGTVALRVANRLGFHYLDSGCLYRLVALFAQRHRIRLNDENLLAQAAHVLPVTFDGVQILLEGQEVNQCIRSEAISEGASKVGALPAVRAALLARQRAFCRAPGLVADGRDMGSVVFPDARLKVFLTAQNEVRAERRYKQLREQGRSANISEIKQDIIERDARDMARTVAPLRREPDALLLDTSLLTIEQSVEQVLVWFWQKQGST